MTAPLADRRPVWSRRVLLAATILFGLVLFWDWAVCRWWSPALPGLAGCVIWLQWGRAGLLRLLAVPLLVVAALWFGVFAAFDASDPPGDAPQLAAEIPPDDIESDPVDLVDEAEAEAVYTADAYAVSVAAPPIGGRDLDAVGAGTAVLALVGIGLRGTGRSLRRPTWGVREVLLVAVAALLGWVSTWAWGVEVREGPTEVVRDGSSASWSSTTDIEVLPAWGVPWWAGMIALGLAGIALWLARCGPPGVRPRWLAGTTLGLLVAALVAGRVGSGPAFGTLAGPLAASALIVLAGVLVASAPAATAVRALRRRTRHDR
ncbi:hypothetical protein [Cryptosporangium aurantiacum]|uniref:hypothetical protein n=1 Tax=Cryptosporangium aurantiacum TaxID=134849 RepID=UPI001160F310|nr:hypothetical protein [Cryptosporangium aurantiacum]